MDFRTCLLLAVLTILQQCHCLLDLSEKAQPSKAERTAAEAINKLLQEKMASKFKEAANEVKGALVKHLGDSLKSAHKKMVQKKKKKTIKKIIKKEWKNNKVAKVDKVALPPRDTPQRDTPQRDTPLVTKLDTGAAIHQNTGPRNRKNLSGTKQAPSPEGIHNNAPAPINYVSNSGSSIVNQNQQQSAQISSLPMANFQYQHPAQVQMQQPGNQMGSAGIAPMAPGVACNQMSSPCTGNDCMTSNPCADVFSHLGASTACPPSCMTDCYGYCPTACCRHKKKTNIPKLIENEKQE